jgi:hypothetical protein
LRAARRNLRTGPYVLGEHASPAPPRAPRLAGGGPRDSAGGITVAWVQPLAGQNGDGIARAATLAADAFGPVEDVSPAESVHEVRLAADGRTGQPVAVWTARPSGQPPSVVRGAARTP